MRFAKEAGFTAEEMRGICIKRNWFTAGSTDQYSRLFDRVREGAEIKELAVIIWLCTPDVSQEEIERALKFEMIDLEIREMQGLMECCVSMNGRKFEEFLQNIKRLRESYQDLER